ncbi:hypothetical protein GKODMF_02110 [Candidatus Electrothrix gigas]
MLFSENNLLKAGKARFFNLSVFSVFSSYHTVTIANIEDEKSKMKFSPSPAPAKKLLRINISLVPSNQ